MRAAAGWLSALGYSGAGSPQERAQCAQFLLWALKVESHASVLS